MNSLRVGTLLFCVLMASVSPGYTAETNPNAAAAQKEGKLIIYSSTDSASVEPLLQDFKALYPFLQVEYNDLNTTEIYNRFTAEALPAPARLISCGARPWICRFSSPARATR